MPATYDSIATTTLGSAQPTISFSSISSAYTDLVVVLSNVKSSGGTANAYLRFNSDTGTNYSFTRINADGSSPTSTRGTFQNQIIALQGTQLSTTIPSFFEFHIFSYASTSVNKTVLSKAANDKNGAGSVNAQVGLWRSTSAITSIEFSLNANNYAADTTATLYGILRA